MYGCKDEEVAHYTSFKSPSEITIDGDLTKEPWTRVKKAPLVDLVNGEPAFLKTDIASLWDEEYLYVAFWIHEPNVKAKMKERDSLVYMENDIEIFLAGEDCYYEFQINALGTIYEVFYIWQDAYTKSSRFNCQEFDLLSRDVDVLGGFQDITRYEKHPRGKRWAFMDWDFPGLKSAVKIQGKLNDSTSPDQGWTVELAFPWKGMKSLFGREFNPLEESEIRVNFSRFELLTFNDYKADVHPGWSLNPHGVYDSHIPRCFSHVHLEKKILK